MRFQGEKMINGIWSEAILFSSRNAGDIFSLQKRKPRSCRIKIGNAINSCNVFYIDSQINQIYTPYMRQSERRKYRDQLQDPNQYQQEQRSFHHENRNARKGDRNRTENPQAARNNAKYGPKKKDDFLGILSPSEETVPKREDYNARYPPRESDSKSQRSDRTQPQRTVYRRKEGEYVKSPEELDAEMEAYQRQGENSKKRQSKNILEDLYKEEKAERKEEEEQDLSFTELKQERNRGRVNKNNESFDMKKKRQKEKQDNDDTEEWIVTASRRQEKPIQQKKPQQKIESPPRPKRQEKQQNFSDRSLNQGFDEVSKESINQSSNWLDQQKILDGLDEDESSQQDILSNASQSYVSSIQGNSRLHHDFDSSHLAYSQHKSILNEQSFQTILQTIQNSMDLQTRQLQLQITSVKNILEIVVKEVSVSKLGMNIELSLKQEGIVVKNSEIDLEKLKEYISFEEIKVSHPRVISDSPIVSTFTLCKLKVPSSIQGEGKDSSKFIKKEKKQRNPNEENNCRQLLRVIKLQLKCMNCQKCSEVPVLESTNEASLSCRKCDEQMIAKLTKLSLQ